MPRNRFALVGRRGQSLIEACLAIVLVCLVFCGVFQVSQLFAAKEFLDYSASRAARAKTVGFNGFMVFKCGKVGCIPNSGVMTEPAYTNIDDVLRDKIDTSTPGGLWDWVLGEAAPVSEQYDIERVRIPEFLASPTYPSAYATLNYEDWGSVVIGVTTIGGPSGTVLQATARQDYPLRVPMHGSFYADDDVELEGRAYLEKHYSLYLDDMEW